MRRATILLGLMAVMLSTIACRVTLPSLPEVTIPALPTIPRLTPGPLEEYVEEVARDGASEARVEIRLGAGEVQLAAGEPDLLFHGRFRTNIAAWAPEVSWQDGLLRIEQGSAHGLRDPGAKNEWDLRFSPQVALDIDAEIGAARGEMDFTGLSVRRLFLETGASDLLLRFDAPNPVQMDDLFIQAGAANLRVDGVGNAGPERIQVEGGVGNLVLDLRGAWPRSARAEIETGVGAVTLLLPTDIGVRVETRGTLGNIRADEGMAQTDNVYVNSVYGQTDRVLEISLSVGMGGVQLMTRD